MAQHPENLVWIDLEMTGLDTDNDQIIEIATIVTDKNLEILAEGPVMAIYQEDSILDSMDNWNKTQHSKSGLLERVRSSEISVGEAEHQTIEFLKNLVPQGISPMCGNSICQDRRFLHRIMSEFEQYFHYRNLDVSSVKEMVQRWRPDIAKGYVKQATHLALDDVRDSIRELIYYRDHFFKM